jgi:diadenylate cyclase
MNLIDKINSFAATYLSRLSLPEVHITDIIEVIIIAVVLYEIMAWIKRTRAWALLKGIIVIFLFILLAAIFQMNTILWLAEKLFNVGMIAIIVVFQPELRHALEQLGRKNFLSGFFTFESMKNKDEDKENEKAADEICRATFEMAKVKTGALIVMEHTILLDEYERTGIAIDSAISSQLILNIFEHNTPLHDGAVIIRDNRITAATCYLPLSDNLSISKELGTRHRAAIGISEASDSLTIVVSEETGKVSTAKEGVLYRDLNEEELKEQILELKKRPVKEEKGIRALTRRRRKDATEKADE